MGKIRQVQLVEAQLLKAAVDPLLANLKIIVADDIP
jgi:hypothetical protein